jgi:hypothetical protein
MIILRCFLRTIKLTNTFKKGRTYNCLTSLKRHVKLKILIWLKFGLVTIDKTILFLLAIFSCLDYYLNELLETKIFKKNIYIYIVPLWKLRS